jgi:hypothetical protein
VVTSSYHRHRAGLLVGRCFPGTVHTREGAALLAAHTVRRGC